MFDYIMLYCTIFDYIDNVIFPLLLNTARQLFCLQQINKKQIYVSQLSLPYKFVVLRGKFALWTRSPLLLVNHLLLVKHLKNVGCVSALRLSVQCVREQFADGHLKHNVYKTVSREYQIRYICPIKYDFLHLYPPHLIVKFNTRAVFYMKHVCLSSDWETTKSIFPTL